MTTAARPPRALNATMAARGLRSVVELAAGKPCGTRIRYYAGCRCQACRAANTQYELQRAAARKRGEGNELVSAARAREHLRWLSRHGVGYKTAADAAKVPASTLSLLLCDERRMLRAQTLRRILAVTPDVAADRAYIDSAATWRLLDELLLAWGYSAARVASEVISHPVRGLQLRRDHRITVRNAARVRAAYERLRLASAAETATAQRQLQELYEEGYRYRVPRELAALAARRGWPPPVVLEPHVPNRLHPGTGAGLLRHRTVVLIDALHASLLLDEAVPA